MGTRASIALGGTSNSAIADPATDQQLGQNGRHPGAPFQRQDALGIVGMDVPTLAHVVRNRQTMNLRLLFLFDVQSVLAETRIVLLQTQLFGPRFAAENIVVVSGFFANEEHGFGFLLSFL